jgi:hypothetical protein
MGTPGHVSRYMNAVQGCDAGTKRDYLSIMLKDLVQVSPVSCGAFIRFVKYRLLRAFLSHWSRLNTDSVGISYRWHQRERHTLQTSWSSELIVADLEVWKTVRPQCRTAVCSSHFLRAYRGWLFLGSYIKDDDNKLSEIQRKLIRFNYRSDEEPNGMQIC